MESNANVKETKLFSAQASAPEFITALRAGSMSQQDANNRQAEYAKVFSRYEGLKEAYKMFSGVTEMPLLSNQYFNATIASLVRSFAGYLTIERDMDQPTALLWYDDVLDVVSDTTVLPNVGPEHLENVEQSVYFKDETVPAGNVQISTGKIIIPGSIKLTVVKTDNTDAFDAIDDGHGNLIAPPAKLLSAAVNYKTGAIEFQPASGYVAGTYTLVAAADTAGTPTYGSNTLPGNRYKLDMKNILVASVSDMLIAENNLIAMAQANKAIGQNPMQVMGAKLVEMYTKYLNNSMVAAIKRASTSSYTINATGWSSQYYDFNSSLNAFSAEMVNIDSELATQSVKGVEATAYVVGKGMANWFRKMRTTGEFVEEKGSTYVNDLLGTYHGIPVLRHIGLEDNEGFAVHKTAGGELAPVMFGQFLPLTWTPNIGNYNNPTQVANGVYFQIGIKPICSELVKRFTIQTDRKSVV